MPFGPSFDGVYSSILKPNIQKLGLHVLRADEIYSTGPIIEDIFQHIIDSDIVIADVSGKNPNVNYELGVSHALKKRVIIVSQNIDDIPFDYRHIRTIIYNPLKRGWEYRLINALRKTIRALQRSNDEGFSIPSLNKFYQEHSSKNQQGLQKVFRSRQNMNIFLEKLWGNKVSKLDIIAFGLKSFRDFRTSEVMEKITAGMKMRILSINPFSLFLKQREIDEGVAEGSIRDTIINLISWAEEIEKVTGRRGAIKIRLYDSLPLDFYWKQDANLFVGPYLHGIGSQQTITLLFRSDSMIGLFYTEYFNSLWTNKRFCKRAPRSRQANKQ